MNRREDIAHALVNRPHPSERGVAKLPPDEMMALLRKAAEQMRAFKRVPPDSLDFNDPDYGL